MAIEEAKEPQRFPIPTADSLSDAVGKLEVVDYGYEELQAWFDDRRPIGMCHACMTKQRERELNGQPPVILHAAVTFVATVQNVNVNVPGVGMQQMPTVLALPTCFFCPQTIRHSKLQGARGEGLSYEG